MSVFENLVVAACLAFAPAAAECRPDVSARSMR